MIKKTGKGYTVVSHKTGKPLSRAYPTKQAALLRLGQIKAFAKKAK